MNPVQLTRETFELVDSFKGLCTKLFGFAKELGYDEEPEKTVLIREQIKKDLKQGLDEAEFLAILAEYLYGLERDRQKLLLDNDLLRDELSYINVKLQIADQRVIDLEMLQRQEQFENEIRAMDELLGKDLEFGSSDGDVNDITFEENLTIEVEDWYNEKCRMNLVTDSSSCTEITKLSKVATTYFTKCLNDRQFEVAVPLCHRVVKDLQLSNADHRHEVAIMLEILTMAHRDRQQFAEAATMLKQALTIYDETLKADNPLIVTTLNNLAQLYSKCDRYAEAEPLCRRALELIKSKSGISNTDVSKSDLAQQLNNMAIVFQNQRSYDTAAKHYREALDIYEDSSQNMSFTAECVNGTRKRLAGIYLHQKQFKKAELLYKDILRLSHVQDVGSNSTINRPIWEVAEEVEAMNRNKRRSGTDSYHVYHDYQMWYENIKVKFPAVDVAMRKLAFAYRKQGMHYAAKMLEHCCAIQNRKTMKVLDASSSGTPANNRALNGGRLSTSRISTPRSFFTPGKSGSVRQLFNSTSTPTASSSESELCDVVTRNPDVSITMNDICSEDEESSGCEDATKPKRIRM